MDQPDIFEQLSDGRFISLSRMDPTAIQIDLMAQRPFRACPECIGTGLLGLLMAADDEGNVGVLMPLPCPECEGSGLVPYISDN